MPPPEPAHPTSPGQTRWFAEEVQPHEQALRVSPLKSFPLLPDHDDRVQETCRRRLRARAFPVIVPPAHLL